MFQKLVSKRNFLIINGTLMIIMGIVWLLYLTTESTKYSMLFYNMRDYAELAIILLLGVMLIDLTKPKKIVGIIMFLISIFIGIIVVNNQIDLFKFSSVDKEWFYRSITFIAINLSLILLFAIKVNFKKIGNHKVEMLIIISLIGIIINWIFMAYKATHYISPKPVESYLQLVRFFLHLNQISSTLCGVGFIALGLSKSKNGNRRYDKYKK